MLFAPPSDQHCWTRSRDEIQGYPRPGARLFARVIPSKALALEIRLRRP